MRCGQSEFSRAASPISPLGRLGRGLSRPECVLAHASGLVFAADWGESGGVSVIAPCGTVGFVRAVNPPRSLRPNGIALEPGGTFLLADLGVEFGGVWRLHVDGHVEPVVMECAGVALPPTNFVYRDGRSRLWITLSTRKVPRDLAYCSDVADGYVLLHDRRGTRIVADNLGYTNECCLSPDEDFLYVNETFARRLSRFRVRQDGGLGERETVARFDGGSFPDGLTFDAEGAAWVTSIVSNRVLRIEPGGRVEILVEDADAAHIASVEEAFAAGRMGRPHLDCAAGRQLKNISSLAFGGPDLRSGYLGSLLDDAIATFESPVAGHPQPHWSVALGALGDRFLGRPTLQRGT